jgi:hypothetical protein
LEKKGCALIIGDQAGGRNILTDLVGVENNANATQSLEYLFKEKNFTTEIAVCDLSPNLLGSLSDVLGEEKIAIDPFHVMQELNRAILKDIARFRSHLFTDERKELHKLKDFMTKQQQLLDNGEFKRCNDPKFSPKHQIAIKCFQITKSILNIYQHSDLDTFFQRLEREIEGFLKDPDLRIVSLGLSLKDKLPKKTRTDAAMSRIKPELLKKLKTLYRECEEPLKDQQCVFNKQRWTIFYQPERLNPKRVKFLTQFLAKYPELQTYRDLTLSVGSIYRLPNEFVSSRLITDLPVNPKWGKELKTCLKTFKKWANAIVRFKTFFEKHKDLPKRLRANMEYQNPKVKKIFRSGNNMKSLTRIQNEVQFNLGGEVRNFLKSV